LLDDVGCRQNQTVCSHGLKCLWDVWRHPCSCPGHTHCYVTTYTKVLVTCLSDLSYVFQYSCMQARQTEKQDAKCARMREFCLFAAMRCTAGGANPPPVSQTMPVSKQHWVLVLSIFAPLISAVQFVIGQLCAMCAISWMEPGWALHYTRSTHNVKDPRSSWELPGTQGSRFARYNKSRSMKNDILPTPNRFLWPFGLVARALNKVTIPNGAYSAPGRTRLHVVALDSSDP
jgi:hypothetical protein